MGEMTSPVELFLLTYFFGLGLAWWSGRESGLHKERRLRRQAVDDAFRRGKQAGYSFLDSIDDARTEAMSGCRMMEQTVVLYGGEEVATRVFDYEEQP